MTGSPGYAVPSGPSSQACPVRTPTPSSCRPLRRLLGLQIKDTVVEGMDYDRLNVDLEIEELTAMWRPLPSVVEMQEHVAQIIGVPALELRPKGS